MSQCRLCPRQCLARRDVAPGVCRAAGEILVARAAPHFGEEPCISGTRGSGAVFFAGCPLGCVYCQNFDLSRARTGRPVTVGRLSEIFRELEEQGVHNLNLVTGTPYVPAILEALERAEPGIPVVWNTSGYETAETVRALSERVSVFLPDMKYADPALAARYSRAEDYPSAARAAIREMVRRTGPYELDGDGMLRRGVLVRHLVLPGQLDNTRRVLRWLSRAFRPGEILVSLMAQYTPCGELDAFPELRRTLTEDEWRQALDALEECGIADGYFQEPCAAGEEAIPAFDGTGV